MEQDIDLERIAALLEGRIGGDERAELLRELAASPEAAELFAEAAAIHAEVATSGHSDAPTGGHTLAMPRRRKPKFRWAVASLPLAAAIAAIIVLPRIGQSGVPLTLRGDAEWLAAAAGELTDALGPAWADPLWTVTRGPADAPTIQAFRVGVRLVDLEVARRAQQEDIVRQLAASVREMLEAAPEGAVAAVQFDRIAQSEGVEAQALEDAFDATVAVLASDAEFDLGLWAEQARLAAAAGDSVFFRTGRTPHEELSRLVDVTANRVPASATQALNEIEAIIASGRAGDRLMEVRELLEVTVRAAGDS